jgi:hypothetical protein
MNRLSAMRTNVEDFAVENCAKVGIGERPAKVIAAIGMVLLAVLVFC